MPSDYTIKVDIEVSDSSINEALRKIDQFNEEVKRKSDERKKKIIKEEEKTEEEIRKEQEKIMKKRIEESVKTMDKLLKPIAYLPFGGEIRNIGMEMARQGKLLPITEEYQQKGRVSTGTIASTLRSAIFGGGLLNVAGLFFIGEQIFKILKGIASFFIKSSPLLEKTMELIVGAIQMVIRPIGDILAMVILPIVILLYRYLIIPFYETIVPILPLIFKAMTELLKPLEDYLPILGKIFGFLVVLPILALVELIRILTFYIKTFNEFVKKLGDVFSPLSKPLFKKSAMSYGTPSIIGEVGRVVLSPLGIGTEIVKPTTVTVNSNINIGTVSSNMDILAIEKAVDRATTESLRKHGVIG